ncbi:MAG: hypothetical protein AB9842_08075 [Bacteroidales bacterium]
MDYRLFVDICESKNMSVSEIAKRLVCRIPTLSRDITNCTISVKRLEQIAKILDVPVTDFFNTSPKEKKKEECDEGDEDVYILKKHKDVSGEENQNPVISGGNKKIIHDILDVKLELPKENPQKLGEDLINILKQYLEEQKRKVEYDEFEYIRSQLGFHEKMIFLLTKKSLV